MDLNDKLEQSIKNIDKMLDEDVCVHFVNVINNRVLVRENKLPSLTMKKKDLTEDILKEKLEYLMSAEVKNIRNTIVDSNDRYYLFDFVTNNVLSSYDYISVSELTDVELLKVLRDVLD